MLKRNAMWLGAGALMLAFTVYWGLLASDRYVSESHVVIENVAAPRGLQIDIPSLFATGGGQRDLLLLRDYLLSVDMLKKLDASLKLKEHYGGNFDVFSRLWGWDASQERFLRHYRGRVGVDVDDYAGLLVIRASAFTPKMAHDITAMLVQEGERFMNELAHRLAREQVAFAEKEVALAAKRVNGARLAVVAHQNQHGLVSPKTAVETASVLVARLQGDLATLQARKSVLENYLAPTAPEMVQVNAQARAMEQQLALERGRLASSKGNGKALNRIIEEYERLLFEAEFAQDIYKTALAAMERSRIEASRMLKKVSILQEPTLPEYALEPRRLYNIVVYLLATLLLTGILQLLLTIIREHRD